MERLRAYIDVILKIFTRDMKRLWTNPIAAIIMVGVCILPALYAWYTIAAFWDPYQNTESIKVAVVNNDEGAYSEYTGHLDVGEEVIDQLKDNHQLGWQFVDEDEALQGVDAGTYYAAIVMPKDFSEEFISVFSGHFSKPKIDFYVNEKLTGSGDKVAEAGASTLDAQIDHEFVSTVSEKLVEMTQRIGMVVTARTEEADESLAAGVIEAKVAIASSKEALEELKPTVATATNITDRSKRDLTRALDDMPALEDKIANAKSSILELRQSIGKYSQEVSTDMTKAAADLSSAAASASAAAGKAAGQISRAQGSVDATIDEAQRALDATNALLTELRAQASSNPIAASAISNLESQVASLQNTLSTLKEISSSLASSSQEADQAVNQISDALDDASRGLSNASTQLQSSVIPQLSSSLDSMADALGSLQGILIATKPAIKDSVKLLTSLSGALEQAADVSESAIESLSNIETDLDDSITDITALQQSATFKELADFLGVSPEDVSTFMASPVKLETHDVFPVPTYGSGVAPFFTNLALWVSGFILMAMIRIRVDPKGLPKFTAIQAYFGRWLSYVVIGLAQSFIVSLGDIIIGIQCINPAAFIGASLLSGFAYVNLMYALAYSMRHVGKAISVILLIVQIPGSSGMFPVAMMPNFYHVIHPLLPFTYSIDAMREAIGGFYGLDYLADMAVLALVFVPIGFIIGLVLGTYGFNLNILFDNKLGQTDLFVAEQHPGHQQSFRMRPLIKALLHTDEYKAIIINRAKQFDRSYKVLSRIGWYTLFALPIVMMVCLIAFHGNVNDKLLMLSIFFIVMVIVVIYLIIISYMDSNIRYQMNLAQKKKLTTVKVLKAPRPGDSGGAKNKPDNGSERTKPTAATTKGGDAR